MKSVVSIRFNGYKLNIEVTVKFGITIDYKKLVQNNKLIITKMATV
jgi:hypothetical protein